MFQNNRREEVDWVYRWGRIDNWLTIVGASLGHIILFCPLLCIWGILYKYKVKENSIYVNCVSTAAGWTQETKKLLSLGRDRRTFSQVSKTCLCSFSKSHFEKQVTIPPPSASTAPAPAGENAPASSSIRPRNYSSQGKQWKPTDSSLSKLDWTEYFQIFSRRQSCSSQALMSVISIICFSIQLQLKAAKFFSTHYGTKWLLNYVMGFFSFLKKKERGKKETSIC